MDDIKQELTNPDTRAKYKHTGNWNRRIQIPGVWSGHVKDIPPHAVEALIKQGRKDFELIQSVAKKAEVAPLEMDKK
jgi:hypothetical protein